MLYALRPRSFRKNDHSSFFDLLMRGIYFLSKFALAEGKGKGEFYTPKCIVNLIAEMIEPYDDILYDMKTPRLIQFNFSSADFAA